jgi:hypothetical protein
MVIKVDTHVECKGDGMVIIKLNIILYIEFFRWKRNKSEGK